VTPEREQTLEDTLTVETETYPTDCCGPSVEQWLTWKPTDDGRKIPRAPHVHSGRPDRYVSAQNPDNGTTFETARDWADKLPAIS
jgi:hypothetical protein